MIFGNKKECEPVSFQKKFHDGKKLPLKVIKNTQSASGWDGSRIG